MKKVKPAHPLSSSSKGNASQRSLATLWGQTPTTPGVGAAAHATPHTGSSSHNRIVGAKRPAQTPLASIPRRQRHSGSSLGTGSVKGEPAVLGADEESINRRVSRPRQASPEEAAPQQAQASVGIGGGQAKPHAQQRGDNATALQRKRAFQTLLGDGSSKETQVSSCRKQCLIVEFAHHPYACSSPLSRLLAQGAAVVET